MPGAVTLDGEGPPPVFVQHLDDLLPARDLLRHRRKYYIGQLDPCASIEFSRGCPWDCTFCSAWTFYGRSYRMKTPERAVEEIEQIREPGLFILDDVAFIQAEHGMAIGEAIARKGIRKQYWLETRADVLLRNKEVFQLWSRIGLKIMFIGVEAIDEEGLKKFRKRVSSVKNFEALEFARKHGGQRRDQHHRRPRLGPRAVPGHPRVVPGDPRDREHQRQHAVPGHRDLGHRVAQADDPRLSALRHPARGAAHHAAAARVLRGAGADPAGAQLASTWGPSSSGARPKTVAGLLARGQTNFLKMLFKFNSVYDPKLQLADHAQPVRYEMSLPPPAQAKVAAETLYIHPGHGRRGRQIDTSTERFVEDTRMGEAV